MTSPRSDGSRRPASTRQSTAFSHTLAASVGEETDTVEDVVEPYLLQLGFLQRTPRGRVATQAAYHHLGVIAPGTLPL